MINGLHEIADRYDVFLLDVWGVLHDGVQTYPGTMGALAGLKAAGKTVCLLSNSPRRAESLKAYLAAAFTITPDMYTHALSSGEAAYQALKTMNGRSYILQKNDGFCVFDGLEMAHAAAPDQADTIVNIYHSVHDDCPPATMAALERAAGQKIPMICVNPDLRVNNGDRLTYCPGTWAARYEEWGGAVTYYGKPHLPFYEQAWDLLGQPDKARIAMIGDSLHTDIQGANGFGIDGIFNLSGIHRQEVLAPDGRDEIDLGKLQALIDSQPHKPAAVLDGFRW